MSSLLESTVNYRQKLNDLDHLIDRNGLLCDAIAQHALAYYDIPEAELMRFVRDEEKAGRRRQQPERVSVVQAMKHYVRDWSTEGPGSAIRRSRACCGRLRGCTRTAAAATMRARLDRGSCCRVPDWAGWGTRLRGWAVSISLALRLLFLPPPSLADVLWPTDTHDDEGFEVTINEWSAYMTAAYRYLESHPAPESHTLHPFLDSLSHHATTADLQRPIPFPEPDAATALADPSSNVLLVEGDFTTVFFAHDDDNTEQQQYDVIITYFFLDTARNPLTYLETIRRLLRPGGHWLNLGPLLYGTAAQVQLSLDEMVLVSSALGFDFLDDLDPATCGAPTFPDKEGPLGKVRGKEAVYGSNARGLTTSSYVAQSWVARKAG
ncbi:hypothetical protein PG991_007994 [Apiospora marii]|uniref:N2227-like domain-containing protein n=1 Tax=Apiospora marii TaxID=335849 RepID=A0ABR1RV12_9PEZI